MFKYKLNDLILKKMIETKTTRILDGQLANEIGITRQTLAKLKNSKDENYQTTTEILEKILKYFDCENITDLIEYKRNIE
jgi:DNA-binding Xre family transcriptional regulator